MPDAPAMLDARLRRSLAGARLVHVLTVPESLRFLRGQISYMRALGIDVTVVCNAGPETATIAEHEGARVWTLPLSRTIDPRADLRHVATLARGLRARRADIVHGHTPKGGLLGMLAAASISTRARVYHMRGLPFRTALGARRHLLMATERLSCALAHRVVCNSPSLRSVAIEARLAPASKLQVLAGGSGNGVDSAHFEPARWRANGIQERQRLGIPRGATVVGYVGRFSRDKGFAELAQAWATIRDASPHARLLLVGSEDARDPVPASLLAAMRADPTIVTAGWVGDPAGLYAAMDVVTLPSYREGFPNVPLEAAAMELPVVTTDAEGCRDSVADGVTGVIVPTRDSVALGAAIAAYVRDGELRAAHGRAGRARCITSFEPRRIWGELAELYTTLLERPDAPRTRDATQRDRMESTA